MATYQEHIQRGLQKSRDALHENPSIDIRDLKLIVFSDHHRGKNDGADDFRPCKAAYHAALGYYLSAGFTLVLLGDVEELWECHAKDVIRTYHDTLILEQRFSLENRLIRFWGNHDDEWQYPSRVNKFLKTYLSNPRSVPGVLESQLLFVKSGDKKLGELFFVHGHQGTLESDRFSWLSRFAVRYLWRPFQRITNIKSTTPASDFNLRLKLELAMHEWASKQPGLILIAGHTHHPVFSSVSHEAMLKAEIADLKKRLDKTSYKKEQEKLAEQINEKNARLNWVLAKSNGVMLDIPSEQKPCYFNTGCCSFSDGDITGIEIENGLIRLVRWPDDEGNARKKILRQALLAEVLEDCH
ncbi:MAG: hypothetical protein EH225_09355 [Calditrichaeota bacterium]|nr:hypothetical protein [Calditrichota bacterium]RQW01716.1 MAG: hypothetical protein EH225_09355 [Calditrichota bacterium]